ncbi:fatty-acid amide hydrolase 2 [Anastrepha obliqua]|uniref:fatty-acid amide hydrolase 2 n=1 Tax=Anastrepha obliqua TaxID=95512 RepID=UPI002409B9DB|nr:fatty-acid amide hydrolase 2 [Anastrepha obliqua]XP_054747515.1 fatty-acid amide hydrolase 2 [Anastrepha obliqua]
MVVPTKSTLSTVIPFIHIILDRFLEFVLGWLLGVFRCVPVPPNKKQEELLSTGAVQLARLIRERKLKSYEVVKAYYDRIVAVNRELNAIVDGPFLEALDEARAIDERFEKGEITEAELKTKPFLGVPFTTKDSTEVAGKLHTLGLVSRRNERASKDAECVRLMKESGAIILATSNVPEVNKWIETRNMLIGQTNNPYDYRRSVGGSSGGEAALISACCTAFGLGTDIGGSTRIPAFNCGIFGHKPTTGAVNMRGCTFRSGDEENTMVSAGPMTRYADDLIPIMKVLIEPNMEKKLRLDEPVDLKNLRYFYIPCNNMIQCNPIGSEEQMLMFKVCRHFTNVSGSEVKLATLPNLNMTGKMWRYWMTQEPANFNKLLGNGATLNPFFELFKKLLGRSEFTMAAIYSLIDALLPEEKEQQIREATRHCKEALISMLGEDGILFFHSSPRTAPFHYYPLIKFTDFSYFSIFNVLQVPVTQVPMGLDSRGIPMGIQVVASEMNDRLCLNVAKELERTFGGWVRPYKSQ